MSALLVVAHGTPRPEANESFEKLVASIEDRWDGLVRLAYLDCNEPTIRQALEAIYDHGERVVIAVPYFLHNGKHVLRDVPSELLAEARTLGLEVMMGRAIGESDALLDVITSPTA